MHRPPEDFSLLSIHFSLISVTVCKFRFFAKMSRNQYFRFKQFTVYQDLSNDLGMKVCTDACVLGAWALAKPASTTGSWRVLDIGTGTGLLALMVAQRHPMARIDAVEIDPEAAEQAKINFIKSPFSQQLHLMQADIGVTTSDIPENGYDAIITNPPFFQQHLPSEKHQANTARHDVHLSFSGLIEAVNRLLKPSGVWDVLLPVEESYRLQALAASNRWRVVRELLLSHQPGKKPFRRLTTYTNTENSTDLVGPEETRPMELRIYQEDGKSYSDGFQKLLRDFYLAF